MVKSYLRYEPAVSFGVIASVDGNIAYQPSSSANGGRPLLLAPALDRFFAWDLKKGLPSLTFAPSTPSASLAVASIAAAPAPSTSVASGHADGSVRIWDGENGTCVATLNGHRSAATALRYSPSGAVLASGGKDCDVVIWDVVAEAGLFRLRGHRDQVTDLVFIHSGKKLVSCSKDKFIRVWDLDTQHCLQIVGGHKSEIWSLDVDPAERFVVTGSADPELRFYHVSGGTEEHEGSKWDVLKPFGELQRQSKDRVANVRFNGSGGLLACQVAGKTVEIYRVLDEAEAMHKAKRRVKRKKAASKKEKAENGENGVVIDPHVSQETQDTGVMVQDSFKLFHELRVNKKICSIAFAPVTPSKGSLATLSLSLNSNAIETYSIRGEGAPEKLPSIELHGHRSDIRSLALNYEGNLLLSTSHNAIKIWNPSSGACLRTIESEYGLCSTFVEFDPEKTRYAIVGTKGGTLEIVDIGSGSIIDKVEAHAGSIRSIVTIPDENSSMISLGFVTGSADHDVKFWEYAVNDETKQLSVMNVRTLKMNDDVLAVSVSPNGKYIAVALLDCTVKVFFTDTLKANHVLYGHKLPVLCVDISSDEYLVVTGSADKNLKIWGLDFGNCHKSIFAHDDSVMDVKFVKNTHYMFSVGKDRLVKYWDADKFQLLLTLEGHHAEVWCLTVSNLGDFIVTGSHDRSIRRWDRTKEPFFLEEERENRLEQMFESDLDNLPESRFALKEVPEEGSVGIPGKKTKETLDATDAIIDALNCAEEEIKRLNLHKEQQKLGKQGQFQPNVLMRGLSPSDYVLSNIHTNGLELALLSLPFSDALKLMSYLKEWAAVPDQIELVCKICTVLLQTHHYQLTATPAARPILTALKDTLHERVQGCKDTIGFNLAAMDHLMELMAMRSDAPFRDAKARLMEIRKAQSERSDRVERRKKRKTEESKK